MCTLITSKGTDIDENIANQNHATRTRTPKPGYLNLSFISFFPGSSSFSGVFSGFPPFFGAWTLAKQKNRFIKKPGIFRYTEKPPQPSYVFIQSLIVQGTK